MKQIEKKISGMMSLNIYSSLLSAAAILLIVEANAQIGTRATSPAGVQPGATAFGNAPGAATTSTATGNPLGAPTGTNTNVAPGAGAAVNSQNLNNQGVNSLDAARRGISPNDDLSNSSQSSATRPLRPRRLPNTTNPPISAPRVNPPRAVNPSGSPQQQYNPSVNQPQTSPGIR